MELRTVQALALATIRSRIVLPSQIAKGKVQSRQRGLIAHQLFNKQRNMSSVTSASKPPVEMAIHANLSKALQPTHLQIINESHKHNVPANSETHFKVVVVADTFTATPSLIKRHRLINAALKEQLQGPVHALSIVAKSPAQWQSMIDQGDVTIKSSPSCRGGDGSLPPK